jgi:hypothetical protein
MAALHSPVSAVLTALMNPVHNAILLIDLNQFDAFTYYGAADPQGLIDEITSRHIRNAILCCRGREQSGQSQTGLQTLGRHTGSHSTVVRLYD